jgi:hypothetical protein
LSSVNSQQKNACGNPRKSNQITKPLTVSNKWPGAAAPFLKTLGFAQPRGCGLKILKTADAREGYET